MTEENNLKRQLAELNKKFRLLRLSDQARLRRELARVQSLPGREPEQAARLIEMLDARFEKAMERSLAPVAGSLHYQFPDELPISSHTDSILSLIHI